MFVEHKQVGEIAETPTTTLRLSQAMRIGASKRPQCRGRFFDDGKSCALGAAMEGLGIAQGYDYPWMVYETIAPMLGITVKLAEEIARRNDSQKWSREGIANWLERQGL